MGQEHEDSAQRKGITVKDQQILGMAPRTCLAKLWDVKIQRTHLDSSQVGAILQKLFKCSVIATHAFELVLNPIDRSSSNTEKQIPACLQITAPLPLHDTATD